MWSWLLGLDSNHLVEVVNLAFGGPVRTNFVRNTKRSYQNDHVFVAPQFADRVTSVAIWNEPRERALSDRTGIIVELR